MSWSIEDRGMFAACLSGWGWIPPSAGASRAWKAAGHFQGSVFRSWVGTEVGVGHSWGPELQRVASSRGEARSNTQPEPKEVKG